MTQPQSRQLSKGAILGTTTLAAALLLSSCAAAANGVATKSAPAIVDAAGAALVSARTFEIVATSEGSSTPASVTFKIGGKNLGEGSFVSSSLSFQAEELHGIDYFRSKTVWSQVGGPTLQGALGDRWVYISASSATATELTAVFGTLTSPPTVAKQLTKDAQASVRGKVGTIDGEPVISVTEPKAGTIYVATTGKPYPLRWEQGRVGRVVFSDFGARFDIKAPQHAVDLAAILAG
ncbi:MAG: hypothetical protein WAL64_08455 [Candidatus Dormiibacterota bacterium]